MTASSRGSRAAFALIRSSRNPRVCSSCLKTVNRLSPPRRNYAAAAAATIKPIETSQIEDVQLKKPTSSPMPKSEYVVKVGIVVSRPPILTKEPNSFEKAFWFYQKRLNERLVMPFSRYFYFKKDTPADTDWKIKAKERNYQPARELGGYNAYSDVGWNDELLVGDKLSEPSTMVEALVRDSQPRAVEGKDGKPMVVDGAESSLHDDNKIEMPLPRTTTADQQNYRARLDRKLDETLYLCVAQKDERNGKVYWSFPSGPLEGRENLHQAAERVLIQSAGINMNTWLVGHAPIGHLVTPPRFPDVQIPAEDGSGLSKSASRPKSKQEGRARDEAARAAGLTPTFPGVRTFFMKARIMAGQANLEGNQFGLFSFKWLTKQEIGDQFSPYDFDKVKDMLADR